MRLFEIKMTRPVDGNRYYWEERTLYGAAHLPETTGSEVRNRVCYEQGLGQEWVTMTIEDITPRILREIFG